MKTTHIFLGIAGISATLVFQSCNQVSFPEKAPADFKIQYTLSDGNVEDDRTIIIQMGECSDKGRHKGENFLFTWNQTDLNELQNLYTELKKIHAFTLESKDVASSDNRRIENIRYVLNKKDYTVGEDKSKVVKLEYERNFHLSIELITKFSESHRMAIEPTAEKDSNLAPTDMGTHVANTPMIVKKSSDNMGESDESVTNQSTTIPAKMSKDFKIMYEMSGGISGTYRNLLIQFGSCTDEGKRSGEAKYSNTWINKDIKEYEELYNQLYKIDAFTLSYTTKETVNDRGGERIMFTINKTQYQVSDKDNDYIKPGDKNAFKKAVGFILAFADKND